MPGSLKSLSKVLETFFSQKSDSDESKIQQVLGEFLEHHKAIHPAESTRLHEELLDVYQRLVSGDNVKETTFLKSITILAPCLVNTENLLIWFDLFFQPAINSAGYTNNVVTAARKFLEAVMVRDLDDDNSINNIAGPNNGNNNDSSLNVNNNYSGITGNSNQFPSISNNAKSTNDISKTFPKGVLPKLAISLVEIFLSIKNIAKDGQDATDLEHQERNRFIRLNVKTLLVHFSKNHPILLFDTLNRHFIQKHYRIKILVLLSAIISEEPRCIWKIIETPLLGNLYNCLLQDKSTAAVSISITILIMIIPHVCNRLAKDNLLYDLFAIYSRLACWQEIMADDRDEMLNNDERHFSDSFDSAIDRDRNFDSEKQLETSSLALLSSSLETTITTHGWDILPAEKGIKGGDNSNLPALDCERLFTFLYALFPANFIDFLRNPSSYMKERNYSTPSMKLWDDYTINSSAKPLFERHILNPYLLKFDLNQELKDTSRFVDMGETEKITVFCLSMHASFFDLPEPPQVNLNTPFEDLPSLLESPIPKESLLYDDSTPRTSRNNSIKISTNSSSLKSGLTRHVSDGSRYGFGSPFTTAYYHRSSMTQPSSPSAVSITSLGVSNSQTPTNTLSQHTLSPIHQDADSLLDAHQKHYSRKESVQYNNSNGIPGLDMLPISSPRVSISESMVSDDTSQGSTNPAGLSLASSSLLSSSYSSPSSLPQDRATADGLDESHSTPVIEFPASISQVLEATQAVSAVSVTSPNVHDHEGLQLPMSPPWMAMASSSASSSGSLPKSTATLTSVVTNLQDKSTGGRYLPSNIDEKFTPVSSSSGGAFNGDESNSSNSNEKLKASLNFFEREYYLLKNELDFVVYIDHHNQVRLKMLKEELMKSTRHFDDVQHLVTTNKSLRGRILRLEDQLSKFREETMKYKNQRLQYETQLTQRNRDLKSQGDKLQQNLLETEVKMAKLKENNDLLYNAALEKEVKLNRLELKVTSLLNEANQFEKYKDTLLAGQGKSNHFDSFESSKLSQDEINALYVRLEKLRIDKEVIEHEKVVLEKRYSIKFADLRDEIKALKSRASNTPSSVRAIIEDIKQASEERYAQISSAYEEMSQQYCDLDEQFRSYALKSEAKLSAVECGQNSPANNSESSLGHNKSLLGYQPYSSLPNTSKGNNSSFSSYQRSSLPSGARNKSSSSSEGTSRDRHHSERSDDSYPSTAGINKAPEFNTKEVKEPVTRTGEVRFRGRGGFQNAASNSKQRASTPTSTNYNAKLSTFRGFM